MFKSAWGAAFLLACSMVSSVQAQTETSPVAPQAKTSLECKMQAFQRMQNGIPVINGKVFDQCMAGGKSAEVAVAPVRQHTVIEVNAESSKVAQQTLPVVTGNNDLNAKLDCIAAHGGELKHSSDCFKGVDATATTDSNSQPHSWKVVGSQKSVKNFVIKCSQDKTCIENKLQTDMAAMNVPAADMKALVPLFANEMIIRLQGGVLHGNVQTQMHNVWTSMVSKGVIESTFIVPGEHFDYVSYADGVKTNVIGKYTEVHGAYKIRLSDGSEMKWVTTCFNFTKNNPPPATAVPPAPGKPVVEVPPTELPPSVSPDTEEAVALVKTTVGVWGGIHTASGWDGHFSGAKATVTLPLHTYLGLDEDSDQLWIGAGIRGDQWRGRSKINAYKGSGQRVVPLMFVLDWNGRGGLVGDTHSGSFNVGVGTNFMKGKNSATGYYKNQLGKEVHVRLENCERSGDWIFCAYAEANGAFGRVKLDGSWSGDTPNKTSSVMIGGSVEYLISDHWSAKAVLEGSIQDNNPIAKLAITAALEVCYRDRWEGGDDFIAMCVGPYARFGEYDGFTFGGTGNIFAGRIWSEYVKAEKSNAVSFPVQKQSSPFIQSSSDGGQEEAKQQGVKSAVNMGLN